MASTICPGCDVRWPTHSMRDLLVERRQAPTRYRERTPLGWTAKLLFVVFNILMAGWLFGVWRAGLHDFDFEATWHAENWESDPLLAATAQMLLPWLSGSAVLGLLTYFSRGPHVFGNASSQPWLYSTGVHLGLLIAVFVATAAPVEDARMTSAFPSTSYDGQPTLSRDPGPASDTQQGDTGSSRPTTLTSTTVQTVALAELASGDPPGPPMFQSEEEIARCDSIIDARRRVACLNGIGLADAASGPAAPQASATSSLSGLPDLEKPVFLTRGAVACQTIEALMENASLGCMTADQDTAIRVLVPRSVGHAYLREEMMGYTRIAWKNSDGRVSIAYAMRSQLRN